MLVAMHFRYARMSSLCFTGTPVLSVCCSTTILGFIPNADPMPTLVAGSSTRLGYGDGTT